MTADDHDWSGFLDATRGRPPSDTLLLALASFQGEIAVEASPLAIDLGFGAGRDTFELLRRGWRVLAIDGSAEAVRRLRASIPEEARSRVEIRHDRFEALAALPAALLVNASFSLPFCPPGHFEALWGAIRTALLPGARFAGQFFGPRDQWASNPDLTIHGAAQVRALLGALEIEQLAEAEEDRATALGVMKHWHVISVLARRPPV